LVAPRSAGASLDESPGVAGTAAPGFFCCFICFICGWKSFDVFIDYPQITQMRGKISGCLPSCVDIDN
jgi:hypothetical protein